MVLPWSQLLQYGGISTWEGHLHALNTATSLVDCTLEIYGTSTLPQTPILLPRLIRLSLSNPSFLECLATPALQELCCGYDTPGLSFLRQQSCKLQKLVLWKCSSPAHTADLASIVDAVPTITNLVLKFPPPTQFALDLSRPSLGPALESISTILDSLAPEVRAHFMQAIESRWRAGQLKSFRLSGLRSGVAYNRARLLQLGGMKFRHFADRHAFLHDAVPCFYSSSLFQYHIILRI